MKYNYPRLPDGRRTVLRLACLHNEMQGHLISYSNWSVVHDRVLECKDHPNEADHEACSIAKLKAEYANFSYHVDILPEFNCDECKDTGEVDGEWCVGCCEHDDTDGYCCLGCGKDLTEDRMAAAYDRAKDFRKYGND